MSFTTSTSEAASKASTTISSTEAFTTTSTTEASTTINSTTEACTSTSTTEASTTSFSTTTTTFVSTTMMTYSSSSYPVVPVSVLSVSLKDEDIYVSFPERLFFQVCNYCLEFMLLSRTLTQSGSQIFSDDLRRGNLYFLTYLSEHSKSRKSQTI